jgi:histidyl-tRNA synthetase
MNDETRIDPKTPRGFVEYLPEDQILFNEMLQKIRSIYERFGFTPIETPAAERTEVLLAKGGGETDKQIYRLAKEGEEISLHFDLTVPLARYAAEHYDKLIFPFRRYQMQKVWRGERNQRGRFREFYQCDIDVIGSDNLLVDAEIPSVIYTVFMTLGFKSFTIRINNRKVLNGFLEHLELSALYEDVLGAIDKIEKQGKESVLQELQSLGIPDEKSQAILDFIGIKGKNEDIISRLRAMGITTAAFTKGVGELEALCRYVAMFGVPETHYKIDPSIVRGLDYYTGTVYETVLNDYPDIGSVCSGGRYDNLASFYTDKKLPGVGISIGLSRLFFKLREAGVIQPNGATPSKVLMIHLDAAYLSNCLAIAGQLREQGINTEVYFESDKVSKQFKYANRLKIPYVILIGEKEAEAGKVSVKSMVTGEQSLMTMEETIGLITTGKQS